MNTAGGAPRHSRPKSPPVALSVEVAEARGGPTPVNRARARVAVRMLPRLRPGEDYRR
jgi:hypothetical protein